MYFSPDYVTARTRFRDAVARRGGQLTALPIAATGPAGEDLTIDIGWFGAERPEKAFVHSSGLHGVEGFAGSAIQLQWLDEGVPSLPADTAVVLIHAVNPYGMAWLRRVNARGVDLNRNCLEPGEEYDGAPDGYDALDAFLNPPTAPSHEPFHLRAAWLILCHGMPALKQAIAGGQYVNPKGLFFGGTSLQEETSRLGEHARKRLCSVTRLVSVDVHTGLGPFGIDTLLVAADQASPMLAEMRACFAGARVSPLDPERGPAYRIKGTYQSWFRTLLPGATLFLVGQEFGTYGPVRVLRALRAENRSHHYGSDSARHLAARALREVFAPDAEAWPRAVLARGRVVMGQALELLAYSDTRHPPA
jgi:hypothetical protein